MRLLISVAGRQPETTAVSAPGCPPEEGPEEEEKGDELASALVFGNTRLGQVLQTENRVPVERAMEIAQMAT